jgi:hypothetical protein
MSSTTEPQGVRPEPQALPFPFSSPSITFGPLIIVPPAPAKLLDGLVDIIDVNGYAQPAEIVRTSGGTLLGTMHLEKCEPRTVAKLHRPHSDGCRARCQAQHRFGFGHCERWVTSLDVVVHWLRIECFLEEARGRIRIGHHDADMIHSTDDVAFGRKGPGGELDSSSTRRHLGNFGPDFSATSVTIAFDDSSLRWLEINT